MSVPRPREKDSKLSFRSTKAVESTWNFRSQFIMILFGLRSPTSLQQLYNNLFLYGVQYPAKLVSAPVVRNLRLASDVHVD